jgi:DNA invertase Pin-like site-specific DNA recombinase
LQTRALIYLWADPTATEVCRMDPHEQQRRCTAWAATRSWHIVDVLVDEPASTSASARPALQQLYATVQDHRCEVVIIPALISLGTQVEAILALLAVLARHAVDLVSLHEAFDTMTAHGSFALLVVRALAEIAQRGTPTRQTASLAPAPPAPVSDSPVVAHAPLPRVRRAALPFGYRQTADGIAIDPTTAPIVRRIFLLHNAGATVAELVQLLRDQGGGRWSQRALTVVLTHEEAYRGGPHPAGGHWPALLGDR